MPELPEVESLRRSLEPWLVGRRVREVTVFRRSVIEGDAGVRELLKGETIVGLGRHGKQMSILSEHGRCVVVQLGMTGQVLAAPKGRGPAHTHRHVVWILDDGVEVTFRDPRRFGGLTPLDSLEALAARWSDLGPDALTLDPDSAHTLWSGSKRAIKAALLDQNVIAGVGNIYADEALHGAGIHPERSAHRMKQDESARLARCIRDVLERAVAARGSTFRDYRDASGEAGEAQLGHRVYGRAGERCLTCGSGLKDGVVAQRTTVWCPKCQARRGSRKSAPGVLHTGGAASRRERDA